MSGENWFGLGVSVLLAVYLVCALLFPEKF
jgi:K+-transporting ATPase KdpF subunit